MFAGGEVEVTPGVRIDYYKLNPQVDAIFGADNPGVRVADLEETSVSPKLGAIWHFTDSLSTYASYARGFRAPPYNDVNIGFTNLAFGYTAIANPDLKPETSNGYEVGLRGENERGFFAMTGFYNDYKDFIASLNFVGMQGGLQVFQSQNLSEAHIYGAELRGGLALIDNRVRIRSSVAYARGAGRSQGQDADQPLNSVDPLKGVVGVAYQHSGAWSVELVGTAVDRRKHVNQTAPQFVPGGYFILDLLAQAKFGEHAQMNLGVFNLTGKKYSEWSDVRGLSPTSAVLDRYSRPGINVGASVAVQF
jgi:hemoglobin/transferrin/lactoferrin receptor protein